MSDNHEHKHDPDCSCGHEHDHKHEHSCSCGHDHGHEHDHSCSCGHDHSHDHEHSCSCGHDHSHDHDHSCSCGHDHSHDHEHSCSCGHDHSHEHDHSCSCGHEHSHDHDYGCSCGHDHSHEHDHSCSCGHEHSHDHDYGCSCGHDHSISLFEPSCGCGCGHDHSHEHSEGEHKHILFRALLGAAFLAAGLIIGGAAMPWLCAAGWIAAGYPVLISAFKNLFKGHVMDENFLMAVASAGALAIGEYPEAAAVMIFYQVGEFFQSLAVGNSKKRIRSLMEIRPDRATLIVDGVSREVHPGDVAVGSLIEVLPGGRVPIDGVIITGASSMDTSALTGESAPRDAHEGDEVLSGCVCINGRIVLRTVKTYDGSAASRVLRMVEEAGKRKAKAESFITRFAKWYTPAVVVLAVLIALVPNLFETGRSFSEWLYSGLVFLVVSCPCALVLSIPLTFFGGIGGASRQGILVKGGNYLEALAAAGTVVFDKTGTLTEGELMVSAVNPAEGVDREMLLSLAAAAESHSSHPVARAVIAEAGSPDAEITLQKELPGMGVSATVGGIEVFAGNMRLMKQLGLEPEAASGTAVYICAAGKYMGCLEFSDKLKPGAAEAVAELKKAGIKRTVMLTGDNPEAAADVARACGMDEFRASLLPEDKVTAVEELLGEGRLIYVGDGINDAPVLTRADVGIAMGGIGSDAAIEASDVVIMDDDIGKIAKAIRTARRTSVISWQNIIFALVIKVGVMVLSVFYSLPMVAAIFADVGVAVICVINAARALNTK